MVMYIQLQTYFSYEHVHDSLHDVTQYIHCIGKTHITVSGANQSSKTLHHMNCRKIFKQLALFQICSICTMIWALFAHQQQHHNHPDPAPQMHDTTSQSPELSQQRAWWILHSRQCPSSPRYLCGNTCTGPHKAPQCNAKGNKQQHH